MASPHVSNQGPSGKSSARPVRSARGLRKKRKRWFSSAIIALLSAPAVTNAVTETRVSCTQRGELVAFAGPGLDHAREVPEVVREHGGRGQDATRRRAAFERAHEQLLFAR